MQLAPLPNLQHFVSFIPDEKDENFISLPQIVEKRCKKMKRTAMYANYPQTATKA